jgi:hypothetical protein
MLAELKISSVRKKKPEGKEGAWTCFLLFAIYLFNGQELWPVRLC